MAVFPTGFTDRVPSRSSKLLGDTGTNNGNFLVSQLLDLFQLSDLPPGLNEGDVIRWDGNNWVFYNAPEIQELAAAGAFTDTNQFALTQGGLNPVRGNMVSLFTYMLDKMYQADARIETVDAAVTSYNVTIDDKNKTKRFMSDSPINVYIPAGLSVGFTMGWIQRGAGVIQFRTVTDAGQTINSAAGTRSGGQHGRGSIMCETPNNWNLSGYTQA